MERTIRPLVEELASRFERAFPPQLDLPRTVGREAEYPIVTAAGTAASVDALWPLLMATGDLQPRFDAVNRTLIVGLDGADYSYALEVGRGTLEINTRPCQHLLELQDVHQVALAHLVEVASQLDWRVLGYGIQPLSPPSLGLLSPKQRYAALQEIMGNDWLWYTVTAADQLHVDVARPELVRLLNFSLMMAPVVVALCGNSPIYAGQESGFCSAREAVVTQRSRYAGRHGLPERPYTDLVDFVERLSHLPFLLRRDGAYLLPDGRPFTDVLRENGADFEAFLLHDHYVWHSARLRVAHATLELRPACQQPPDAQMAAAALYLGLIEAADAIERSVDMALGEFAWETLRAYQQQAMRDGMAVSASMDEVLGDILFLARRALEARGYGEEQLLAPLWKRLVAGENPAQQALGFYHREGMAGLIEAVTLPA